VRPRAALARFLLMTPPDVHHLDEAGAIPNSGLPVLLYTAVDGVRTARDCAELFAGNGWLGAWVDGIYAFHHFHSTAHEVLGIVAGSASVVLGGPRGRRFDVTRGDVLVLPAGTGHCTSARPPTCSSSAPIRTGCGATCAAVIRPNGTRFSPTSRRCPSPTPIPFTAQMGR